MTLQRDAQQTRTRMNRALSVLRHKRGAKQFARAFRAARELNATVATRFDAALSARLETARQVAEAGKLVRNMVFLSA